MSWAVDVAQSAAHAKAHFRSVRKVAGGSGGDEGSLWLAGSAADRFEAARSAFAAAHPGYAIPYTTVGQSMRGFHQERRGLGMLGHALGVAIDLFALDNPNQRGRNEEPMALNAFMLRRFGGAGHAEGRSTMSLSPMQDPSSPSRTIAAEDMIARVGQNTAAGISTRIGEQLIETVHTQFNEMAQTSDRVKAGMAAQLHTLEVARSLYVEQPGLKKELSAVEKELKRHQSMVSASFNKKWPVGNSAVQDAFKLVNEVALAIQLGEKRDELAKRLEMSQRKMRQLMDAAFKDWQTSLNGDIDTFQAANQMLRSVAKMDKPVNLTSQPDHPSTAKAGSARKNAAPGKPSAGSAILAKAVDYNEKWIAVVQKLKAKLSDPLEVFGDVKTPRDVSAAPVMQYVKFGFLRHDQMPPPTAKQLHEPIEVFNVEVVTTLVRYGFSPGATYGDTQHFDFIQGYDEAAPGGRSQKNIDPHRYSPVDKPEQ
jgi:hypothetical protein